MRPNFGETGEERFGFVAMTPRPAKGASEIRRRAAVGGAAGLDALRFGEAGASFEEEERPEASCFHPPLSVDIHTFQLL
jgi:hypothetical protein